MLTLTHLHSTSPQWIEYHRLLGVEHFYIYDNNSEDAILARLQGYMDAGVVTYIHWPFRPDKGMHWNQVPPRSQSSGQSQSSSKRLFHWCG